jgi:hypothetical protein
MQYRRQTSVSSSFEALIQLCDKSISSTTKCPPARCSLRYKGYSDIGPLDGSIEDEDTGWRRANSMGNILQYKMKIEMYYYRSF